MSGCLLWIVLLNKQTKLETISIELFQDKQHTIEMYVRQQYIVLCPIRPPLPTERVETFWLWAIEPVPTFNRKNEKKEMIDGVIWNPGDTFSSDQR